MHTSVEMMSSRWRPTVWNISDSEIISEWLGVIPLVETIFIFHSLFPDIYLFLFIYNCHGGGNCCDRVTYIGFFVTSKIYSKQSEITKHLYPLLWEERPGTLEGSVTSQLPLPEQSTCWGRTLHLSILESRFTPPNCPWRQIPKIQECNELSTYEEKIEIDSQSCISGPIWKIKLELLAIYLNVSKQIFFGIGNYKTEISGWKLKMVNQHAWSRVLASERKDFK